MTTAVASPPNGPRQVYDSGTMPPAPAVLTVLKLLAAGRDVEFVTSATELDVDQITAIAEANGWPDQDKISWAADLLDRRLTPSAAAAPVVPALDEILTRAKHSERARTRQLAERIHGLVDDLAARLTAEDDAKATAEQEKAAKAAAKARSEAAKQRARDEVRDLEEQLRKARAKLRPTKARRPPGGQAAGSAGHRATHRASSPAQVIREWARANDVPCPARGRVPRSVSAAYHRARGSQLATTAPSIDPTAGSAAGEDGGAPR